MFYTHARHNKIRIVIVKSEQTQHNLGFSIISTTFQLEPKWTTYNLRTTISPLQCTHFLGLPRFSSQGTWLPKGLLSLLKTTIMYNILMGMVDPLSQWIESFLATKIRFLVRAFCLESEWWNFTKGLPTLRIKAWCTTRVQEESYHAIIPLTHLSP